MSANDMPVTVSHLSYKGQPVPVFSNAPRSTLRAQKHLLDLYDKVKSWKIVGTETGIDKGLARRVALVLQRAPRAVRTALYPETSPKRPRLPGLSKPKQRQLARLLGPLWGAR